MRKFMFTLAATLLATGAVCGAATINEIRIDNSGGDTDEFFELAGQPGESLDGLTYLVIGDGTAGVGVIENVTDLTGLAIQADGFFAVHKSGTIPVCTGYDVDLPLNFENSDNVTHLLVSGFTGADGDQIDVDQDGVLDVTPWSAVIDAVALLEEVGAGDPVYTTTTVGPDGSYVPGLVMVCGGLWHLGEFDLCVHDSAGGPNTPCAVSHETSSFSRIKAGYR